MPSDFASLDVLKIINGVLSLAFLISNAVYAIWGLVIRNKAPSMKRDKLGEYVNMLDHYVNVVSFIDCVIVPLKVILFITIRYCCHCRLNDGEHSSPSSSDNGFTQTQPRQIVSRKGNQQNFGTKTFQIK